MYQPVPCALECLSVCCCSWTIVIENNYYTYSSLPLNSGIDFDKQKFPLKVKLNWYLDGSCPNHVTITRIALDQ